MYSIGDKFKFFDGLKFRFTITGGVQTQQGFCITYKVYYPPDRKVVERRMFSNDFDRAVANGVIQIKA